MGIRDDQKDKRRQEILVAALILFVKKGYKATKITDIAKSVNMSTGLLFHYFESKEKLYLELVKMGLEGTKTPIEQNCTSGIEFFEKFALELFSFMKQQPMTALMFVLMADAQRSESTPEEVKKLALKVDTAVKFVDIVEMGQKDGTIRQGDPLAISNAYWSSIQGVAEQFAAHPEIPLPEAEWIVDIVRAKEN